jgi:hypothetical protein
MDDRNDEGGTGGFHPLPPRLAAILEHLPVDRLVFTPAPVKARRDGWTVARQIGFIHRLALCSDVGSSARGVGMSRESAWRLRKRPGAEGFAATWDEAARWGGDRLADLGMERCLEGERRGVYYRGRKVGEQVHFNNSLLIAVLNRFPAPAPPDRTEESVLALNRALDAICPPQKTNDFLDDSA